MTTKKIKNNKTNKKSHLDRPFVALHNNVLDKMLANPARYTMLESDKGRCTRRHFLRNALEIMRYLIAHSDLASDTPRVGHVDIKNGEGCKLTNWETVRLALGLSPWTMRRAIRWLKDRGWITSKQPRQCVENKDGTHRFYGLTSIKMVTRKYLYELGIYKNFVAANEAAYQRVETAAKKLGITIGSMMMPRQHRLWLASKLKSLGYYLHPENVLQSHTATPH